MAVYKRRIFLINPKFQYKFSLILCSFILLATIIYPFIVFDLFESMIQLQPESAGMHIQARQDLMTLLAGIEIVVLAFLFVFSIFLSHKIAGPMYKLSSHLRNIRSGGEVKPVFFRSGDYFQEVADEVNETLDYFVEQRQEDFAYLEEVSAYLSNLSLVVPEDKKPVLNEIQSNLAKIQSRNLEA